MLVKLNWKRSPPAGVRLCIVVVPSGKLMFTVTLSTAMLSVTFAMRVMVSVALKLLAFAGCVMTTCGPSTLSSPTKKVVSVELILLVVSLAKKVMLYCPVRFGMVKVVL